MRFLLSLTLLFLLNKSTIAKTSSAATFTYSTTLHAWPLSSKLPSPFLTIAYNPTTNAYKTTDYKPPALPSSTIPEDDEDHLTRIGLYDAKSKHWSGVLAHSSVFHPGQKQTVTLHLDERGEVQHVGFHAFPVISTTAGVEGESEIQVVLQKAQIGPEPHLNKPVMVDAEGKEPEVVVEKTLLQKYWWVLAGMMILVVAGGGSDK